MESGWSAGGVNEAIQRSVFALETEHLCCTLLDWVTSHKWPQLGGDVCSVRMQTRAQPCLSAEDPKACWMSTCSSQAVGSPGGVRRATAHLRKMTQCAGVGRLCVSESVVQPRHAAVSERGGQHEGGKGSEFGATVRMSVCTLSRYVPAAQCLPVLCLSQITASILGRLSAATMGTTVITIEEVRAQEGKEEREESILAMLGIVGTFLNLFVIVFVYIYTTL
ncbi:hypothetical protein SKAU_G00161260 [Synaphobranchus kaupii]|uniref:Uncharacterized protein n=1 Tax=Synaphobranchus kaupii TaxID=118154 RepID=A0A9Q1FIQ8_SYNKA|nr:hypothetical protein SKAU_G00161260 [Synaphobranchus kaupii]